MRSFLFFSFPYVLFYLMWTQHLLQRRLSRAPGCVKKTHTVSAGSTCFCAEWTCFIDVLQAVIYCTIIYWLDRQTPHWLTNETVWGVRFICNLSLREKCGGGNGSSGKDNQKPGSSAPTVELKQKTHQTAAGNVWNDSKMQLFLSSCWELHMLSAHKALKEQKIYKLDPNSGAVRVVFPHPALLLVSWNTANRAVYILRRCAPCNNLKRFRITIRTLKYVQRYVWVFLHVHFPV